MDAIRKLLIEIDLSESTLIILLNIHAFVLTIKLNFFNCMDSMKIVTQNIAQ